MTIEESLEWLISRKEHYEMDDSCQELAQALDMSIDIMRKYQKIQEIVKNTQQLCSYGSAFIDIREIIEDE
jgi:hypothetical protein